MSGQTSVWERGHALSPGKWRDVLSCGDHLDRFPCKRCGAGPFAMCVSALTPQESLAASEFINGYGWDAAQRLAEREKPPGLFRRLIKALSA